MVDFVGQKRIFILSVSMFVLTVPLSILFGFVMDSYQYSLYFCVFAALFIDVLFVPNWPWFNINKPNWKEDEEAIEANNEELKKNHVKKTPKGHARFTK